MKSARHSIVSISLLLCACTSLPTSFKDSEKKPLLSAECAAPLSKFLYKQNNCSGIEEVSHLKQGLWCCVDSSGKLLMASHFHAGLKDGRTELYSSIDGHLESISTWKNGQLEGPQMNFYKNGSVANEYALINGRFTGEMRDYDETGQLHSVGHYKNGERHGLYQEWDRNGALIREENDK